MTAPARVAAVAAAMLMASGHGAAQSTLTIQVHDCLDFESLIEQALSAK